MTAAEQSLADKLLDVFADLSNEELPAYDEIGTPAEEASFQSRADRIIAQGLTAGERRALSRKKWILAARSGGEVLLAERMIVRGLMTREEPDCRTSLIRTRIGQHVLRKLR